MNAEDNRNARRDKRRRGQYAMRVNGRATLDLERLKRKRDQAAGRPRDSRAAPPFLPAHPRIACRRAAVRLAPGGPQPHPATPV